MGKRRIEMINIRLLLRLRFEGRSERESCKIAEVSRERGKFYYERFKSSGIMEDEMSKLSNSDLLELLDPEGFKEDERLIKLRQFFPRVFKELKKTGVTKELMWQEYKEDYPDGLSYSRFCSHYRNWNDHKNGSIRFEHKAGDKMFVDFAGKKLFIYDRESGEAEEVEVFVAILGASQLTYAEAVPSQKVEDFIGAVENSFHYYKGVPALVVPDNLKSAVITPDNYEAELNRNMKYLSEHYGTAVLPARPGKPKDKAHVENAVKLVYRYVYAEMRNQKFYTLEDLNREIIRLINLFNQKKFKLIDKSRRELFDEIEKDELRSLVSTRYEVRKTFRSRVSKYGYIFLSEDKHHYSAPYKYIGKYIQILYTGRQVYLYFNHCQIAVHKRDRTHGGYASNPDHLAPNNKFIAKLSSEKIIKWASEIGSSTEAFIINLIKSKAHPEIAFKSCMGVLNLGQEHRYGKERLNNACMRATHYCSFNYKTVERILKNNLDLRKIKAKEQLELPIHKNIRGTYN